MKRFLALVILLAFTSISLSQFKSELEKKDDIFESNLKPQANLILGIFNPDNFSMSHSYQFLYSTFGSNSLGLGIYTNSMKYKFADNLNVRVDVSLMHSPFGSYNKNLGDQFSGIFINRADINYKPFNNCVIQLKFRQTPYSYYGYDGYYGRYLGRGYDPIFGYDSFDDEFKGFR